MSATRQRAMLSSVAVLLLVALGIAGCVSRPPQPATPQVRYEPVGWQSLEGWSDDRVEWVWAAFLNNCKALQKRAEWSNVCSNAATQTNVDGNSARRFFEAHLTPYRIALIDGSRALDSGMITGYYEPLLRGSRQRSAGFPVPLYAKPDDLLTLALDDLYPELKGRTVRGRLQDRKVVPYFSREALANNGSLAGKELVWVDSAVDAFFLQIQGSGRVQLQDGKVVRMAYVDQNGHPYRAIGRYLVERGELTVEQASAQGIRAWLAAHPERQQEVLNSNPSFVFFREEPIVDPNQGPNGALGIPLTAGRSIAVDPRYIPLGTPVFLATTHPDSSEPLRRMVLAQDTGGAIKGAVRADLFWGTGPQAGESAGRMRQDGRLWLLWPKGATPPVAAL